MCFTNDPFCDDEASARSPFSATCARACSWRGHVHGAASLEQLSRASLPSTVPVPRCTHAHALDVRACAHTQGFPLDALKYLEKEHGDTPTRPGDGRREDALLTVLAAETSGKETPMQGASRLAPRSFLRALLTPHLNPRSLQFRAALTLERFKSSLCATPRVKAARNPPKKRLSQASAACT